MDGISGVEKKPKLPALFSVKMECMERGHGKKLTTKKNENSKKKSWEENEKGE